jgi:hypothetical protein
LLTMSTKARVGAFAASLALLATAACASPVDDGAGNGTPSEQPTPAADNPGAQQATGLPPGSGSTGSGGATGSGGGSSGSSGTSGSGGSTGSAGNGGTLEPGLEGYWSFEDFGKTVTDSSGNGLDGSMLGNGISLASGGKVGQALDLAGTDGRVVVPSSTDLDFTSGATIEFWIRLSSVATGSILSRMSPSGEGVRVRTTQGNLQVSFSHGISTSTVTTGANVLDGNWSHVAIVNDGAEINVYLDGQLETTGQGGQLGSVAADLVIGKAGTDNSFDGFIDEVTWYDATRGANEICQDAGGSACQ